MELNPHIPKPDPPKEEEKVEEKKEEAEDKKEDAEDKKDTVRPWFFQPRPKVPKTKPLLVLAMM